MSDELKGAPTVDSSWLASGLDEATQALIKSEEAAMAPPAKEPEGDKKVEEPANQGTPDTKASTEPPTKEPEPAPKDTTPPPAKDEKAGSDEYIKQLHEDRKKQDEIIVKLLEEQQKLLSRVLDPAKPAPTPEEQEQLAEAERQRLLANPDEYFKKREAELLKKATDEASAKSKQDMANQMGFKSIEQMESHFAATASIKTLESKKDEYPLMGDESFRKAMGDQANLQEIAKLYPPSVQASAMLKDPMFWHSAYQRAALAYLAKPKGEGTPAKSGEPENGPNISASPPNTPAKTAGQKTGLDAEWDEVMGAKTGAF